MLRALTVSCTEVSTGRTVVFMQTSPDLTIPAAAPPRTLFRADRIGPQHALASAAIPLLFPPVRIDGELYLDGGLRQNTPIAPALRLGATHIFAIGSSREVEGRVVREAGHHEPARAPGAAFLLGKVLNAFLLDHVDVDIELLTRINSVLVDGTRAFGSRVHRRAQRRGAASAARQEYRYVNCMRVRPSEDIGRLANDHLKRGRLRGDPILTKRLFNLLDLGVDGEADLASYLLFDGPFCRRLIEMGRADAQARRDELLHFFRDAIGPRRRRRDEDAARRDGALRPRLAAPRDVTRSRQRNSSTGPAPSRTISGGDFVRSITVVGTEPPAAAVEHEREPAERRVDLVRVDVGLLARPGRRRRDDGPAELARQRPRRLAGGNADAHVLAPHLHELRARRASPRG